MSKHIADKKTEEVFINLGRNIATARKACGWTQTYLANVTGVSRSTIGKIESFNSTDISISTILSLAGAFNIPPYILLLRPYDWQKIANVTTLRDVMMQRNPRLDHATIDRLKSVSQTGTVKERLAVAQELQRISEEILSDSSGSDMTHQELKEKVNKAIGVSGSVSTALAADMLPSLPVLNAMIARFIAVPIEQLLSKNL